MPMMVFGIWFSFVAISVACLFRLSEIAASLKVIAAAHLPPQSPPDFKLDQVNDVNPGDFLGTYDAEKHINLEAATARYYARVGAFPTEQQKRDFLTRGVDFSRAYAENPE